jgi:hypothetical protein
MLATSVLSRSLVAAAVALTLVLSLSDTAQAQEAPPAFTRDGITFGLSLGGGNMHFSQDLPGEDPKADYAGVSFDAHVGYMIMPKLSIELQGWGITHFFEDDISLTVSLATIGARYFVMDRLWLAGGLGAAVASIEIGNATFETDPAFGVSLGAGYEVWQTGSFALDVNLKLGYGAFKDDVGCGLASLNVGGSWY